MDEHQMLWNEKAAKDILGHMEKRRIEGGYASTGGSRLEIYPRVIKLQKGRVFVSLHSMLRKV
jgi:hypothetical protein